VAGLGVLPWPKYLVRTHSCDRKLFKFSHNNLHMNRFYDVEGCSEHSNNTSASVKD
jgi:hypothetical protein